MQHYWPDPKFISIAVLIIIFSAGLGAQTVYQTVPETDYDLQVVKFYFQKQEFNTVIDYIFELEKNSYISDSLTYYLGMSFLGIKDWETASDFFASLLTHSIDYELTGNLLPDFKTALSNLSVALQIEKITGVLNQLYSDQNRIPLLFMLAGIYEEARLFEEANDVYRTILNEVRAKDGFTVDLKIAANYIFLKEYQNALDLLKPIISLQDSLLNKDALFLDFIANSELENLEAAQADLIGLYLIYPDHSKRFEIIEALSDLFMQKKQYLLSWYLLEDLKKISDPAQLYQIENKISSIKGSLAVEKDIPAQFDNLVPLFKER